MILEKELFEYLEANNWLSLENEDNAKSSIEAYIKTYKTEKTTTAYLFRIRLYYGNPPEYVMAHAINEEEARIKASTKLYYNGGDPVRPEKLKLVTRF